MRDALLLMPPGQEIWYGRQIGFDGLENTLKRVCHVVANDSRMRHPLAALLAVCDRETLGQPMSFCGQMIRSRQLPQDGEFVLIPSLERVGFA